MFFSVIAENWNWEILTKNLATFKRWDGVIRMKNFNITGFHSKVWFLGGGSQKNNIWGELPKRGNWTVCRFKAGEGGGGVFEGYWYPMLTMQRQGDVHKIQFKIIHEILWSVLNMHAPMEKGHSKTNNGSFIMERI